MSEAEAFEASVPSSVKNADPSMDFCSIGRGVISEELQGLESLLLAIDERFSQACRYLLECRGRIVVTGVGKSGHVARKIAATLSSTGSPAFFLHAAEAAHGDLGMMTPQDVVLALSHSGSTREILEIVPLIKRLDIPLISITREIGSPLAKLSHVALTTRVQQEACPFNLAPTTSTTVSLVLGDALSIALLKARGFTKGDFAVRHPGGTLGKRLLLRVRDIMHTGDEIPSVAEAAPLSEVLVHMAAKGLGMAIVTDEDSRVIGVFTDGDLRRTLARRVDIHETPIGSVMTKPCRTMLASELAYYSLDRMESLKINGFPVVDENHKLVGAFNWHDLLRAGVV